MGPTMASAQSRRHEDRKEHQQNESDDIDTRRTTGSHWGPAANTTHQSATVAGASAIKHGARGGGFEEQAGHTVPVSETERPVQQTENSGVKGVGNRPQQSASDKEDVLCGPLLNYRRMSQERTDNPIWHGSVLIVTTPGQKQPELNLRIVRDGQEEILTGAASYTKTIRGQKLYEDPKGAFWSFPIEVPFQNRESMWEYGIEKLRFTSERKVEKSRTFAVPAKSQSMRIMFHSCNGFSAGTDVQAWSGTPLWNDVLRLHRERPFHIMLGGGDQIYNDEVRIDGPLRPWSDMGNPKKRREFPFNEDLRKQCDKYYFDNYVRWFNTEPFASTNCQIPQLNIWDDHDIIDGFGSYTNHFMQCAVFRGIGGIAYKYYLLFQHHLPPPKSTFTTDAPVTHHAGTNGTSGADYVQLEDSWVMTPQSEDPSYIIGKTPGPYVEECSRSIYCQLGAHIALIGIDARTERTRRQVNYPETYDAIFARASSELTAANGTLKHLILLLGIPIAYPRLDWLEQIFRSPLIGPLRFLNKRFGVAGHFFNSFDGNVDLLDDLDDHYTAHAHKRERKDLMMRLQDLAKQHSVRVTILGGDVHLAAVGRFYSNPKVQIPAEQDWRFMPNIVSSAITNKPPPQAVANLLARRNKIHHLDEHTDETLLHLFEKDPSEGVQGVKAKTADTNHVTMPSRNFAIISPCEDAVLDETDGHGYGLNGRGENADGNANGHAVSDNTYKMANGTNGINGHTNGHNFAPSSNPRHPLHAGEAGCGTFHPAAGGIQPTTVGGKDGLDVTIRVEISASDRRGKTVGYGFSIPALDCVGYRSQGKTW